MIEKLTFEGNFCDIAQCQEPHPCKYTDTGCTQKQVWERLKEYEDTELTPKKVTAIKHALMGKSIAKVTEFDGVPLKRLRELAQADKEGRCVILPCKVGDTVWYLTGQASQSNFNSFTRIEKSKCDGFFVDEQDLQIRLRYHTGYHGTYGEYGKTVFLTREEAEAALKKQEAENATDRHN